MALRSGGVTKPMAYTKGQCLECNEGFWYWRYRTDKNFCSTKCRNRYYYVNKGTYSERERRAKMSPEQWKEHKRAYDRERLKDPIVRAKHNERNRRRYDTDEYRAYSLARYHRISGSLLRLDPIAHGYTGHKWFDLARQVVGNPPPEDSVFFDMWADRMGAAVLALLEGKDMREAVKEHNRQEYVPNNRTIFMSDWTGENEYKEASIGTEESAESEAIARERVAFEAKARYSHGRNRRRFGNRGSHHGKTAPTRRESFRDYQDRPGNRRDSARGIDS